ncbi:MAG: hypothetical protein V7641_3829 [Blastocatellia bacterium]
MEHNRTPQGAPASAFSTHNRQLFWTRFFVLTLFLALSVMSVQTKTSAQAADKAWRGDKASLTSHQPKAARNCPECEQAYVQCLSSGGGANCHVQYDACIETCH